MLALGYGEAGSKIIASNIKSGGDLNPMLSGQKIIAIFGFCDIHHFSEVAEAIEVWLMMFVN